MNKTKNRILRYFKTINYPSYVVFFVTARCNADCKICFYKENIAKSKDYKDELTVEEYDKITKGMRLINILGISGGEPFLRDDLADIVKVIYKNSSPLVVDLPTNAFFVESVLRQTEDIAKYCKEMTIDLQLSIDGPERIHDEMRGLKGSFNKVKESYEGLLALRVKHRNLKLKACVVYSSYNEEHMEELFNILDKDFKDLDRIVFSVVHGSVQDKEAFNFSWDRYFEICDKQKENFVVNDARDFHSIFTMALRMAKNGLLKDVLKKKDMYKRCGAGRRVIAIGEKGDLFACEPLWHSLGNLRTNGYDINKILNSSRMKDFCKRIIKEKCNCHWGLPLSNTLIYTPRYYPRILYQMARIAKRSHSKDKRIS